MNAQSNIPKFEWTSVRVQHQAVRCRLASPPSKVVSVTCTHRCTSQRRRIHVAAEGSSPPPEAPAEEIDYSTVNVEELEPVPIMDQNIKPGTGDETDGQDLVSEGQRQREEESWNRREGYLSYFFGPDENKELLIKQLPERQLDLSDVYVLDYEKDTHAAPKKAGVIVAGATNYQVIPVETFVSGDVFEGVEEKHLLEHLILIKVLTEDPHKLDFTHTYCFNCSTEELYRVSYIPVRDPSTIEDPVLRFQPENNMFILDSKDTMPSPMLINLKYEAEDLGVDFDVDLYSGLAAPEGAGRAKKGSDDDDSDSETTYINLDEPAPQPATGGHSEQGRAGANQIGGVAAADVAAELAAMMPDADEDSQPEMAGRAGQAAMEAAVAEEAAAGEETSNLTTGTEIDTDDTPDVPAVDLA